MRISDWSSDVCSSDLLSPDDPEGRPDRCGLGSPGSRAGAGRSRSSECRQIAHPPGLRRQWRDQPRKDLRMAWVMPVMMVAGNVLSAYGQMQADEAAEAQAAAQKTALDFTAAEARKQAGQVRAAAERDISSKPGRASGEARRWP